MARPASRAPAVATEESIVHALFDLANHLMRRGERLAATVGLTTQQWIVLLQIAGDPNFPGAPRRRRDGVLPSEIAAARGVTRATVSAVVAALLTRGLIAQVSDDGDKRRRRLTLTPAGDALIAELAPLRRAANRRLFGPLSRADREALLGHLRTCLASLDDLATTDS
ncbi:MAG: winged helix DNA-binding protein [Kofleriaceae bacterium]|nr:winged helix DNA-binding protein [Myxococcales bacterium]MCB9571286.1 winged helix DNA-binding protein [Kofleriaceae bacterium]